MKYIKGLLAIFFLLLTMGAAADAFGFLGFGNWVSWKEEVLLHDGQKIIVERSVVRGGRHETGQMPPYREQKIVFTNPGTNKRITWEDNFSADIRTANFLPMLLDMHNGIVYLVANPMGCLSYNKWGRPNPPYVIFKYESKLWQRIPLEELPEKIKTPNLIFSAPDIAVERSGSRFMTAEMIKAIISGYRQPEYRTILRESIDMRKNDCVEMVYSEDGTWLGIGWFLNQSTYEACLKVCEREKVSLKNCPCDLFFDTYIKEK